jgi:hypothetical protein
VTLNLKFSSLPDIRLKIFAEMEADLEAQFLELLDLRERVRKAASLQGTARARRPAPGIIAATA